MRDNRSSRFFCLLPHFYWFIIGYNKSIVLQQDMIQWYAPIKIIGIKIIVPIKSEKSLRLMVHISKTLTKSLK